MTIETAIRSNVVDLLEAFKLSILDVLTKHGVMGSQALFNLINLEIIDDECIVDYLPILPMGSPLQSYMIDDFKRSRLFELIEMDKVKVSRYINNVKMPYAIFSIGGTANDR